MADELKKDEGPKDITPSPMADAEKKNAAAAPADAQAAQDTGEKPQDAAQAVKQSLFDSKTFFRMIQFIIIALGLFGLFLALKGQEFKAYPGAAGALMLTLATLLDVYVSSKFNKEKAGLGPVTKFILAGIFAVLTVTYIVEIFVKNKIDMPMNKDFIAIAFLAMIVVFSANFFIYIRNHKQQLVADVQMFMATILSAGALVLFYYYFVVPAFIVAGAAVILLILSLTKDPLKDDERYGARVLITLFNFFAVLLVLAYAATIFFVKPIDVMNYGKITPAYKSKPANLIWSGDSWSFAYNIYDKKKASSTVNILNSLSIGINTLPPDKSQEVSDQELGIKLPIDTSKMEKAAANLLNNKAFSFKKKDNEADLNVVVDKGDTLNPGSSKSPEDEIKLPRYVDAPFFNSKGNFLIFSAGDSENGPRDIWGVSLTLTLLGMKEDPKEKEKLEDMTQDQKVYYNAQKSALASRLNMPFGKPKVVIADINKIIDKPCEEITHKTAWSPDGKSFCFSAANKKGIANIWSSNVIDQTISKVTKGDNKIMPLWSPAGDKLLYVTKTDSYSYLKVADMDGRNAHELNIGNKRDADLFPLWNDQQSRVIYLKKGKLIIMNANATEQRPLSRKSLTPSPYWLTEKKKQITLEFTESGTIWRIFTITPQGRKNKQIFEETCEKLTQPKWSYDGKAIVCGAYYNPESALWRLDSDGGFKTRLYTTKHEITDLEWSPPSERIAFIVKKKSVESFWLDKTTHLEELWCIDNDGSKPIYLYTAEGEINHLSWDNEGKRIAFDETYSRLYFQPKITVVKIVHAIGSEIWDLLPYEFYAQNPTWSGNGNVIAYISWPDFWMRSLLDSSRLWIAQLK
jgi:Tol biopolymer transport system component